MLITAHSTYFQFRSSVSQILITFLLNVSLRLSCALAFLMAPNLYGRIAFLKKAPLENEAVLNCYAIMTQHSYFDPVDLLI